MAYQLFRDLVRRWVWLAGDLVFFCMPTCLMANLKNNKLKTKQIKKFSRVFDDWIFKNEIISLVKKKDQAFIAVESFLYSGNF